MRPWNSSLDSCVFKSVACTVRVAANQDHSHHLSQCLTIAISNRQFSMEGVQLCQPLGFEGSYAGRAVQVP